MALKNFIVSQVMKPQVLEVNPNKVGDQDNHFLSACAPLFVIAARIKKISRDIDPLGFQRHLITKIQQAECQLQQKNIRAEQILTAKYFISVLLDDLVEHDWLMGEGLWRAYNLRFYFFQEHSVDERLFTLIDRLQQEPSSNIALLELAYMVLIYGYQGHFRQTNQGYYQLLGKIDALYSILNTQQGDFQKSLFVHLS